MPQARYEIDGDVAEIVISNPPLNLWGPSLQLTHAVEDLPLPTLRSCTDCVSSPASSSRLAAGPTMAHAATKAIVRAQGDHGTRGADERTADLTSHRFEPTMARMRRNRSCAKALEKRHSLVTCNPSI